MHRRFAAGFLDLGIGGIQAGNAQIVADGIVEKVGLLGDIAFHPAQVGGIDLPPPACRTDGSRRCPFPRSA